MNDVRTQKRVSSILIGVALCAVTALAACDNSDDEAEATMIGPLADSANLSALAGLNIFYFIGTVDLERTSSCGSASPASTTSSSTDSSDSSSSSSSSSSTSSTKFDIDSFWYFQTGEGTFSWDTGTLTMRFEYNQNKESFTLNPVDASASTCFTADGINCNGSSDNGNPECVTLDNVKCGGEQTFIYTNEDPEFTFQANSGTIEYNRGFNLDDSNEAVSIAKIDFSMIAEDGTIFQGKADCRSQEQ